MSLFLFSLEFCPATTEKLHYRYDIDEKFVYNGIVKLLHKLICDLEISLNDSMIRVEFIHLADDPLEFVMAIHSFCKTQIGNQTFTVLHVFET